MAQLSDDCFAFGGGLTPVDDALARLARVLSVVAEPEEVGLDAAHGRILAADVAVHEDVPPHDNSAVDGFAVYFDDLASGTETVLPVVGRAAAGHPYPKAQRRGEAVRIFTGAPMPAGPDTVMMQEDCRVTGGAVVIRPGISRGANRRFRGEDLEAGSVALEAGRRLRAQDVGMAAAAGRRRLSVYRPLRAAVFSTGDEICEPGGHRPDGSIYDSNRFALSAGLSGMGCRVSDLGIIEDDRGRIGAALLAAAADHDVIITSGGVSTGGEDHVRGAVEDHGSLHFWRLAIKPGRPVALGQVGQVPFIGLPGNPVAAMVTFLRIARPLLLRLAGAAETAPRLFRVRSGFDYAKKRNRREYVRVRLEADARGTLTACRFPREGAGILSSMVYADGLVELPEAVVAVVRGNPSTTCRSARWDCEGALLRVGAVPGRNRRRDHCAARGRQGCRRPGGVAAVAWRGSCRCLCRSLPDPGGGQPGVRGAGPPAGRRRRGGILPAGDRRIAA